ncbi:MAG: prolyl 4-hydroxylase [Halieaceae bacterium]|jgi:prolyl 4-hydroxylase
MTVTESNPMKAIFEVPDWLQKQSREQQAMAPYCGLGFKRGRLPADIHDAMLNKLHDSAGLFQPERQIGEIGTVDAGYIPAVCFEDHAFNNAIGESLKSAHEQWSGMALLESACYGFRAYQRGSYLHNHVDRGLSHIISSTVCVDYQLEEPWPLFVEDIYGEAHQVTLEPGEFLFYEGARLLHGRPWPLKGDYYIGMFIHYRPASQEA